MADVKPTPTQAENDAAAMGEHVMQKEPDGSPPDPNVESGVMKRSDEEKKRQATAGVTHQTRVATPTHTTPPRTS